MPLMARTCSSIPGSWCGHQRAAQRSVRALWARLYLGYITREFS